MRKAEDDTFASDEDVLRISKRLTNQKLFNRKFHQEKTMEKRRFFRKVTISA